MITWPRQPAHRNRRPDTATACPASQTLRRRTPSSAGYSSCIRARHGVGHGVDTELPGYDRRRACPQFCQAVAVMSSPLPAPPGEAHRPVGDGRRHSKNNVAIAPLGGRNGTPAPSMRGFSPPLTATRPNSGANWCRSASVADQPPSGTGSARAAGVRWNRTGAHQLSYLPYGRSRVVTDWRGC
jgi:hypothetical protein